MCWTVRSEKGLIMEKYTASEWAAMEGGHEVQQKLFEFMNDEMTEVLFKKSKTVCYTKW